MSVRMKLTFSSPSAADCDKTFANSGESLEERVAAFKKDEELMKETNKFVTEVIETATFEATKRAEQNANAHGEGNKFKGAETIAGWNNRARGFCNRVWNAVFPCFNNNELLAWAQPFRYRFTRP
ncbi:PREDICTED: uncharacterized protein LOC105363985 [Ceratosolen solmsi marchali]|uniref:Uncharacterized protein LOC105363985 n=1 Tax=Ceratosolen solmsi marchali TaxID=326594 RepID=A0AAJ7DXK0_9HYME|nr:PREDICTED: uncharacterized protein LOC105363985 [Ceratosolen solmsi marchali]XP_011500117.1 PREDICTED: uncharacterized protein LOC105363985 [Ceratosolen solmsi marchali]